MTAFSSPTGWGDYASTSRRNRLSTLTALLALIVIIFAGVFAGPSGVSIGLGDAASSIVSHIPLLNTIVLSNPDPNVDSIVWQMRMPRLLSSALIGALLGLAGVALQGMP